MGRVGVWNGLFRSTFRVKRFFKGNTARTWVVVGAQEEGGVMWLAIEVETACGNGKFPREVFRTVVFMCDTYGVGRVFYIVLKSCLLSSLNV